MTKTEYNLPGAMHEITPFTFMLCCFNFSFRLNPLKSFPNKVNMCSLFNCLFHTRYIPHVLTGFYSKSQSSGLIVTSLLIIQNKHCIYFMLALLALHSGPGSDY